MMYACRTSTKYQDYLLHGASDYVKVPLPSAYHVARCSMLASAVYCLRCSACIVPVMSAVSSVSISQSNACLSSGIT